MRAGPVSACPLGPEDVAPAPLGSWIVLGWTGGEPRSCKGDGHSFHNSRALEQMFSGKGLICTGKEQPRRIKAQEIKALRRECSPGRDSDSSQQTQGTFKTNGSTSSVSGQEYLLQSSMLSCLDPGI